MTYMFDNIKAFDDAYEIIKNNIRKINDFEYVSVYDAFGRICHDDIYSVNNLPLFSRSQVDGYAVITSDLQNADREHPVTLELAGQTYIGNPPVNHPGNGKCMKVPTGAAIPVGADAMVPFEDAAINGNMVTFNAPVDKFNEISNAGLDVMRGERLAEKFKMLDERDISVIAATGQNVIKVFRKINIGIIPTGDELIRPGENYVEGKIFESNSIAIYQALKKYNSFNVKIYDIVRDSYEELKKVINASVTENDVTITIGSTSAGEMDYVYKIIGEYKPGILFHGVRVKPGKPVLFAKAGERDIFGLPGFPVSSIMLLYTMVLPNIFSMVNYNFKNYSVNAIAGEPFDLHRGNTDILLLKLVRHKGSYFAYQVRGNSGSISRIMRANGFSTHNSVTGTLQKGDGINVNLFDPHIPEILIAGQYLPDMEFMPYDLKINSIFAEFTYNDIRESMLNNEADVYISNYNEDLYNENYDKITFLKNYGLYFNKKDYKYLAVLYKDSGLFNICHDYIKGSNIILLDRPGMIPDYVFNKRCDAGISYSDYSEMYKIPFEPLGRIRFNVYINKTGSYYKILFDFFNSIKDKN